mmetsp:Transcript_2852/g.6603  ORF Transcript_2852/g.6603 Transcript_2852/m.6603 type:complete len:171 (-) Transcript_2852:811-1323(-)
MQTRQQKRIEEAAEAAKTTNIADDPPEPSPSKVPEPSAARRAVTDMIEALDRGDSGAVDADELVQVLEECGHENSAACRIISTLSGNVNVDSVLDAVGRIGGASEDEGIKIVFGIISKRKRNYIEAEDILQAAEDIALPISADDKAVLERLAPMTSEDLISLLQEDNGRE